MREVQEWGRLSGQVAEWRVDSSEIIPHDALSCSFYLYTTHSLTHYLSHSLTLTPGKSGNIVKQYRVERMYQIDGVSARVRECERVSE